MEQRTRELFEAAMELSESERADLAELLWATVEPDEGLEEAWAEEIRRRIQKLEAGEAELIPWQEVKRRVARTGDA